MNALREMLLLVYPFLHERELCISDKDLHEYWSKLSLLQIERIFTLTQAELLKTIQRYIGHTLNLAQQRTHSADTAFQARNKANEVVAYLYDCKMFKNKVFDKTQNQFIGSLLIAYRCLLDGDPVLLHEFVSDVLFNEVESNCLIKVKQSCLMRLPTLFKALESLDHDSEDKDTCSSASSVLVLPQNMYHHFLALYMTQAYNASPISYASLHEHIRLLFRAIRILLHNQLYLAFYMTLSPQQIHERRYNMPIKVISKPKSKQEFTIIDPKFCQVRWYTLVVKLFHYKYERILQKQSTYECYLRKARFQDPESSFLSLSEEDKKICWAFVRQAQINDDPMYMELSQRVMAGSEHINGYNPTYMAETGFKQEQSCRRQSS